MTLPCVVLAGSLGTHMRPITEHIPKTLIKITKRPFAKLQMKQLAAQNINDIVYSIGHLGGRLHTALDDDTAFNLRITYVDKNDDLHGTTNALRKTLDESLLPKTFFVLYGDSYLTIDLASMEHH